MKLTFNQPSTPKIEGPTDLKPATWYRGTSQGWDVILYRNSKHCITIVACQRGDQITTVYSSEDTHFGRDIHDIIPLPNFSSFTVVI